jgi:hypothetical protein
MKTLHYITLAACFAFLAAATPPSGLLAAKEPMTMIPVEDIGTKVALVGRLGQPLGTLIEVKGTWHKPEILAPYNAVKDSSLRFTVSHVNGTLLKSPVELHVAQVKAVYHGGRNGRPSVAKAVEGASWTLRAYERGRFEGSPENWYEVEGTYPAQSPHWLKTFTTELVGVVQER